MSPGVRKWLFALLFLTGGLLLGIQIGEWTAPKPPAKLDAPVRKAVAKPAAPKPAVPKPAAAPRPAPASSAPAPSAAPARYFSSAPKVAIVLDDWGYNLKAIGTAVQIKEPLTLAVLPHLPYSAEVARQAHAAGHEIMLHMPMEPINDVPLEEGTILTSMAAGEVKDLLGSAIRGIPFVRGVNNHMGSKVTKDPRTLGIVMSELKARNLFFLNSMTTGSPVGRETAGDVGLDYAERDIFLDNERTEAAILRQLEELKATAIRNGSAIGIGHDEPVTLRAIQKVLPAWRAEGIEVHKLSDLIRHNSEGV